jgi:hypothetical protein
MPPKTGRRPNRRSWGRLEGGPTDAERIRLAPKSVVQRPLSRHQQAKNRALRKQRSAELAERQQLLAGLAASAGRSIPANVANQ